MGKFLFLSLGLGPRIRQKVPSVVFLRKCSVISSVKFLVMLKHSWNDLCGKESLKIQGRNFLNLCGNYFKSLKSFTSTLERKIDYYQLYYSGPISEIIRNKTVGFLHESTGNKFPVALFVLYLLLLLLSKKSCQNLCKNKILEEFLIEFL